MTSPGHAVWLGLLIVAACGGATAADAAPRPKKMKTDAARLERRLAKLEAQAERLTKEVQNLREQLAGRLPDEEKRIFYLKFVKAAELATVLRDVYNAKGKPERIQVVVEERLNSLIVRGSKADLPEVEQLIEQLDRDEGREAGPALRQLPARALRPAPTLAP